MEENDEIIIGMNHPHKDENDDFQWNVRPNLHYHCDEIWDTKEN